MKHITKIPLISRYVMSKNHKKKIKYLSTTHNSFIAYSCSINNQTIIEDNVYLKCGSHNNSVIGRGTYTWSSTDGMKIGRFCSISSGLVIVKRTHPILTVSSWPGLYNSDKLWDGLRLNDSIKHNENLNISTNNNYVCEVGNDVWIGQNVMLKGGIKIGNGAIIGMGAVVVKDVPPYAIVGGNPAKIIRYRFSHSDIEFLEQIKWWNWDLETIRHYSVFFSSPSSLREALKKRV